MKNKIKIGALISGGGTNLQAVIDSCENNKIDGKIVFVGSDNPDAYGLKRAEKHKIPNFVVDYNQIIKTYKKESLPDDYDPDKLYQKQNIFSKSRHDRNKIINLLNTRIMAERALLNHIETYDFDLLILAGFMRNLSPYFIDHINNGAKLPRIMNIHPALLPAFPGIDGYGDTFNYGCKVGGCTVHFIDYGEDSGPIIGQKSFSITPEDTEDSIRKKGLALEWDLYPECIQLFADNRLNVKINNKSKNRNIQNRLNVVILPE
ncbi:phosphoribosylglycinamide formyltransferase [Candidatus Magnetomorum sp. HK-1]|nr:phosphoribosylglycinamide formyltransferase [Candidatus Magnetomorum sp. HK-1]